MTRVEKLILNSTVTNDMMSNVCFSPHTPARACKYILIWWLQWSGAIIPDPRQMQAAISSRNNNFQLAETQRLSEIHGICFLDISNHTSRFQYYSIFAADFLSLIFYEAYRKVKGKYFSNSLKIFVMWWCLMSTMQRICKTQQGCLHYITSSVSRIFVIKQ